MRTRLLALLAAVSMLLAACGGGTAEPEGEDTQLTTPASDGSVTESGETDPGDGGNTGGASDEPTPEASGPLGENTFRIGDQTWERTLPMTTGQCFLQDEDSGLPASASAWGTLDNDEDLSFAARYSQDGSFESEVHNNDDMYWGSGPRFGEDDLVIELDFDNLIISGSGTFVSLTTGERAMGSFQFICEPRE